VQRRYHGYGTLGKSLGITSKFGPDAHVSQVRIQCVSCPDYDTCVPCFAGGKQAREHKPAEHEFRVIEQHSIPIFTQDWGADEELLLIEGAETYGLGSWADIADHIGGCRTKEEVRDHYISTYIDSPKFPLPVHADRYDRAFVDAIPREEFQARKKRRIEERKEAAKNAPPSTPKQKPTASVPACHEVQGYMPGRLEFETEYFNEAEEAVQHMQFEPGDGVIDQRTGQLDPEMDLKMTIMGIYNQRLDARVDRKKIIFEHRLLEYKKNQAIDKKRTKEERDLFNRAKPFARMMKYDDFQEFTKGLEYEHNLRQAISMLQEWRSMQIGDLKAGEKYEAEKQARASRPQLGMFDRLATNRINKPTPPIEAVNGSTQLVSPDLALRPHTGLNTPPASEHDEPLTNGVHTNGLTSSSNRPKFVCPPIPGVAPLKFDSKEYTYDLHLLTPEEREVCSIIRVYPKPYIMIKETVLKEAMKTGGALKKKAVREICRLDANKGSRLFDFFVHNGWITKA
jgi:transcriptional adapter 2-alpha